MNNQSKNSLIKVSFLPEVKTLWARGGSFHWQSLIRRPNSLPDEIASQDLKQTLLLGLAKRFKSPIHTKPEFVCNKGFD